MKFTKKLILTLAALFFYSASFSQLSFNKDTICPTDSVKVTLKKNILDANFNNLSLGPMWSSTAANPVFNNPCGQGPDGAYLWVGTTPSNERTLVTDSLDISASTCNISWYMKYGSQSGAGNCEDPDSQDEGVHLQYSTNSGNTWTDFPGQNIDPIGPNSTNPPFITSTVGSGGYWEPDGVPPSPPTQSVYYWHKYENSIPSAAVTTHTMLRWAQLSNSSSGYDAWGIDEVKIHCPIDNFQILKPNGTTLINPNYLSFPAKSNSYDTCVISSFLTIYGITEYDTACVHVLAELNSDFTMSTPSVCEGDTLSLSHNMAYNPAWSYTWTIDNTNYNVYGPVNIVLPTGNYNAKLKIGNGHCEDITNKNFTIHQKPSASFGIDNYSGCEPLEVNFSNYTTNASSYLWDFGDGSISTIENPTHYFPAGSHDVKLTAYNTYCVDSTIINNLINVSNAPDTVLAKHYDTLIAPVADTYQWYDCGTGQIIPGATSSIYVPQVDGYYKVVMTLGNCTTITDCYHVVIGGLNNSEDIGITLKPNPTKGQFNLIIEKYKNIEFVEIYNSQMQLVKKIKVSEKSSVIDLSDYAAGNYNILIINNDGKLVEKTKVVKL